MKRCKWCNLKNELYIKYHDEEWCKPNFKDQYLYEMLILESFQAGLSWECILNKRESFRQAFDNFDIDKICNYDNNKIQELLENKNIIRNKLKIKATINNSKIFKKIQNEYGSFYNYLKTFTKEIIIYEIDKTTNELSDKLSRDLQNRGMKFVGSVIIYSYLQAIGVIYSHDKECFMYKEKDYMKVKKIKRYSKNEIDQLANILKNNGIISVPTDTVFGICARINSKIAHDKLIKVKNRPIDKAFPIMCANEEQIKSIAIVDEKSEKFIKAFMPGPITLILKKRDNLPSYVTNGKDTIAVRMATSKAIEELIIKTESPIFMTSANQSGERECINLDEIEKACPLLDGMLEGSVVFSKGSTIVDCSSDEIKILREGPISLEQILILFQSDLCLGKE